MNSSERSKKYYESHKALISQRRKIQQTPEIKHMRHVSLKEKAFSLLGNKCLKCGFEDIRALQIDHIGGGGRTERLSIGSTAGVYRKIVSLGGQAYLQYQVLCANCNWIKRCENNEHIKTA